MKRACCLALILVLGTAAGCREDGRQAVYTGVLEGTSVHVPALTGGKIVRIDVDTGQEVSAGDTLAVVDTTELALQARQLTAALEEIRVQVAIARTSLQRTQADLNYAMEKRDRMQMLYQNQTMPRQNLDDLQNLVQQAASAHRAARQQIQLLGPKRRQVEAQIEMVRKRIADAVIVAPTDGLVAARYFEAGEAIPPMQAIVELIHIRELDVKIYIPEERLPLVKYGQEVTVRADGLDAALAGRVAWVSPKAEFTPKNILTPETRTSLVYAVKITVPNPERVLKHGMPVEVTLPQDE